MISDRNPDHLYPDFAAKVKAVDSMMHLYAIAHMKDYEWKVTEGFRTTERQKELYAQGRTKPGKIVTHRNGTTKKSPHQSGLAVDFAPFKNGKLDYNVSNVHWEYFGHCARQVGLEWGGDWKGGFVDKPHIEWNRDDAHTYAKAKLWLKENGLT